jgi:hypothetical protein
LARQLEQDHSSELRDFLVSSQVGDCKVDQVLHRVNSQDSPEFPGSVDSQAASALVLSLVASQDYPNSKHKHKLVVDQLES